MKEILVNHVIAAIEELAPLELAESWDNPGLMVGNRKMPVTGIITALDPTLEVVDAAIEKKCNLIITHHPLIFKPLKNIDLLSAGGQIINKLIENHIALYSAHTNLDIAEHGLNDMLATKIHLQKLRGLEKTGSEKNYKLVCFVPESHLEVVRQAMGEAGAGFIGKYSHCSFVSHGQGFFRPEKDTHPFIGKEGVLEEVSEARLETIVPQKLVKKVVLAMLQTHPYEEVAYDLYPLVEPIKNSYLGRIGELPRVMNAKEFKAHLTQYLPHSNFRFAGVIPSEIKTVALCSGGGAEFIGAAKACGADAYLTGDVKYHDAQHAKELQILVVDGGHFGTEECVAEGLKKYLQEYSHNAQWDAIPIYAFENQKDFFIFLPE